jgi:cytochrome b561
MRNLSMSERSSYTGVQIALHWITVVLVAINYVTGDSMAEAFDGFYEEGENAVSTAATLHVWLGMAVILAVVLRLLARAVSGAPAAPRDGPQVLNTLGTAAHWLLYALLAAVPALGMLAWFAGVAEAGDIHVLVMNLMLIVAGLHALAALAHHFVLRDGVLMRMIRPS